MRITPIPINPFYTYNTSDKNLRTTQPKIPQYKVDTVSFNARISERFPKTFLNELLHCGLPCPVCGKDMIPLDTMYQPAEAVIPLFKAHFDEMTKINKIILTKIATIAPFHPRKNIQHILQMLKVKAEKQLVREQTDILNRIYFLRNEMTNAQLKKLEPIIERTRTLLLEESIPQKKFKRKSAISEFDDLALSLSDDKLRVKIMSLIRELPTSSNNENAFIVKYSSRSPEEIGMKLYNKDFGTLEHIIPDSQGGRIVIWECCEDNGARGNRSIQEQLNEHPEMPENFQKHIDRLISIYHGKPTSTYLRFQKDMQAEYILALKNEYAIASNGELNADISELGNIPPQIILNEIKRIKEMGYTNYLRNLYKMLQEK